MIVGIPAKNCMMDDLNAIQAPFWQWMHFDTSIEASVELLEYGPEVMEALTDVRRCLYDLFKEMSATEEAIMDEFREEVGQ